MSSLAKFQDMLRSTKTPFTLVDQGENLSAVFIDSVGGEDGEIKFLFKKQDFHSATFIMGDPEGVSEFNKPFAHESKDNHYDSMVSMMSSSPVIIGRWGEVESDDGQYIGIMYTNDKDEYYTIMVFQASTKTYLGTFVIV